jgi:hypothetical protein
MSEKGVAKGGGILHNMGMERLLEQNKSIIDKSIIAFPNP